ncbi:uncharacterized protein BXZ73DRAFT_38562 [Epithele typhae]|uniref:uncharacterized protein n=1 Tax=Epithele typhae TaxID=378194 RepID=UPI002007D220|nr:uncharacterized protein BXZ73DRAFT_38562 [Epithele typhae]KAH9945249.1 hypothetical protein BXZ73DRAFT_38562 [Epithele typhae]
MPPALAPAPSEVPFPSSSSHARKDSAASSLRRRSRTKTRSIAVPARKGTKEKDAPATLAYDSDAGESFLDFDDAPPVPPVVVSAEPEEMSARERDRARQRVREAKKQKRRSRTLDAARSSFLMMDGHPPQPPSAPLSWKAHDASEPEQQDRGRREKSAAGSVKGSKPKPRGLSLPRQAFRQNPPSDGSSQPSPITPYGFGSSPIIVNSAVDELNRRDSVLTHMSSTSSSLYPASTVGSRTESSMLYTDSLNDADVSYPDIVTPDHPDFDPDDVSYRLRLLLNNSYFLPPAHAKPNPFSLTSNGPDTSKPKPAASGFLTFFGFGKTKSKPTSPAPGSPSAAEMMAPILRTTSDTPSASGLLNRQQSMPKIGASAPAASPVAPTSRVVVLREQMDDLVSAAKQAEKELRTKADARKFPSSTTPRNRFVDDVIDPTDVVDLPPPSADSPFAMQTSTAFGFGPMDSVGAAVLADRLVPGSPAVWSINSEDEGWRKDLLHKAVSHSLTSTPDHSFSSSDPVSPPAQSEASFPIPTVKPTPKPNIGQRIIEDFGFSEDEAPGSPSDQHAHFLTVHPPSLLSEGPRSPLSARDELPFRAETPNQLPSPLSPAPRKQIAISVSQPDLQRSSSPSEENAAGLSSGSGSYHTVRKAASTPGGLSAAEEFAAQRAINTLSPPPIPEYRSITPSPVGLPSLSTSRSRTESGSRYSSDSVSFRTPMDTDVDMGARPSMSYSVPSGRPSVSVSEYSVPSPTASAFNDALFGSSSRPPSVASRRAGRAHAGSEPPLPSPRLPTVRHPYVNLPPPRVSTSVPTTELPLPPRPPPVKPVFRNSTSTRSSGTHHYPSTAASENFPPPSARSASFTQSPTSGPSSPSARDSLSARRGLGAPLSLTIPGRSYPPAIHSAPAPGPAPASDFFDRLVESGHMHNALDDFDRSEDEDEESEELSLDGENARSRFHPKSPPAAPRASMAFTEAVQVFVDPHTSAISNRASSASARPSLMRLGNRSTPQLSPASGSGSGSFRTPVEPLPHFTFDHHRRPIANVPGVGVFKAPGSPFKRTFAAAAAVAGSSSGGRKRGKGIANVAVLPIGAVPSAPLSPGFGRGRMSESSAAPGGSGSLAVSQGQRRPKSAGAGAEGRKVQRESILLFDGMLTQHLADEKSRMKRITNEIVGSATNSPVQGASAVSGQMPFSSR